MLANLAREDALKLLGVLNGTSETKNDHSATAGRAKVVVGGVECVGEGADYILDAIEGAGASEFVGVTVRSVELSEEGASDVTVRPAIAADMLYMPASLDDLTGDGVKEGVDVPFAFPAAYSVWPLSRVQTEGASDPGFSN